MNTKKADINVRLFLIYSFNNIRCFFYFYNSIQLYMLDKHKIEDQQIIFEPNRRLNGWTLKVMEDWGGKIKKRFITNREKALYLEEFGEKLITDNEFFDWWCKINNLGKYHVNY